ncbi:MAG: hypothetical protein DCF31_12040 [Alphaproteobacteria bacterium]|nr:MAG: hypothetical protein DCF31_12040 [Alphaproteobacteria bacterium]
MRLPIVIPAQAGIHLPPFDHAGWLRRWIPACAGMTALLSLQRDQNASSGSAIIASLPASSLARSAAASGK